MADIYAVVGASGTVGKQVLSRLIFKKKPVFTISGRWLSELSDEEFYTALDIVNAGIEAAEPNAKTVGLILAHRQRGHEVLLSLRSEIRLCDQLVRFLASQFQQLNVVVFGSVTGSLIDKMSCEAYHYAKDLQKSAVRQSIGTVNVNMNLLELSCFIKYPKDQRDEKYRSHLEEQGRLVGVNNLPNVSDITDFALSLIDASITPRGQIITHDGGYSLIQK